MRTLWQFWRGLWRRDHEPRLWPIVLQDVCTREVHCELGSYSYILKRVYTR